MYILAKNSVSGYTGSLFFKVIPPDFKWVFMLTLIYVIVP